MGISLPRAHRKIAFCNARFRFMPKNRTSNSL